MFVRNLVVRNNWYVAAFSSELGTEPLGRTICGQPVVLYRTSSGSVVALEDRCIHRGMPLSKGGAIEGEEIRCPYHGLKFGASGACTLVPGQPQIPSAARIYTYPVLEQDALCWIWMGDPAQADSRPAPRHLHHSDPQWAWSSLALEFECNWEMLNDNLTDLTHVGYVHAKTIGGEAGEHSNAEIKAARTDTGVSITHYMPDSTPPPFYRVGVDFKGKIDRWKEIDFRIGFIRIFSGGTDAGTGAFEGKRIGGVQLMGMHAVTPSTATSCYYFFSQSRNFKVEDAALTAVLHEGGKATLLEDKVILEEQQRRVSQDPQRALIDLKADAGSLMARRLIEQRASEEQPERASTAVLAAAT